MYQTMLTHTFESSTSEYHNSTISDDRIEDIYQDTLRRKTKKKQKQST